MVRGLAASATTEWITNRELGIANAFRASVTWVGDTSFQAGAFWLGRFPPAEAGTPYPADPLGIRVGGGQRTRSPCPQCLCGHSEEFSVSSFQFSAGNNRIGDGRPWPGGLGYHGMDHESGNGNRECLQGFRDLGWGHAFPSRGVLAGTVSAG